MRVSAQYAQEHFADILSAADNGEEVEIDRPGKPLLLLYPRTPSSSTRRPRRQLLGAWETLGIVLPTDEEWKALDQQIEHDMLHSPIFPENHA